MVTKNAVFMRAVAFRKRLNRLKKKRRGISVLHTAIMNIYTLPEVMEYRRPEDTASPWKTVI